MWSSEDRPPTFVENLKEGSDTVVKSSLVGGEVFSLPVHWLVGGTEKVKPVSNVVSRVTGFDLLVIEREPLNLNLNFFTY